MTPSMKTHLTELTNIDSVELLWDLHCRTMARYGFDRLFYGFTRFRTANSLGDPNDFVILTNHNSSYRDGFIEGGLYRDAPMVQWALDNEGVSSWAVANERIAAGDLSEAERRVAEFNVQHGVNAGYTISFKSVSSRAKGAVALTARREMSQGEVDAVWADNGAEIVLMNNIVHLKILTLPVTLPNQNLTPRQREALEWVGDGKTMQDIAQIMGLTQATVEKHLRLARETLNVGSRPT